MSYVYSKSKSEPPGRRSILGKLDESVTPKRISMTKLNKMLGNSDEHNLKLTILITVRH